MCFKYKGYEHYDYQCSSESQHVRIVPTDEVDDSKVVEDVQVPPKTVNIIEDIAVNFDTPIIDEIHMFSDSVNDDVDEIVEPNTPTIPSQSLILLVLNIVLWLFLSIHLLRSHLNFLSRSNRWFLILPFWVV